ncbi:hypothetical protein PAPYR_1570 [Paratrimastix pyriformis]|uniref:Uncharacterized protein n=1 Tax=Paratrimastix pyriformis TaxID=342808 RepID=A0ABQ8UWZ6_9EUKA|nr:hypothetical protein PAPYR_1570 [Paratrimastix pyriformis]
MAAFVGSLSALTTLRLHRYPPQVPEPVSHLTTLELTGVGALPGPGFCRLESLALGLLGHYSSSAPLAQLLTANQATLRSLTLTLEQSDALSLVASLRALPRLRHLHLTVLGAVDLSALLPADLVNRLERLEMRVVDLKREDPVRIVSSHLQRVRFALSMNHAPVMTLDCPALVELDMTEAPNCRLAALQCPRLRTLRLPTAESLDGAAPMPDLEVADFSWGLVVDPAWLLTGSPRLRALTKVQLRHRGCIDTGIIVSPSSAWMESLVAAGDLRARRTSAGQSCSRSRTAGRGSAMARSRSSRHGASNCRSSPSDMQRSLPPDDAQVKVFQLSRQPQDERVGQPGHIQIQPFQAGQRPAGTQAGQQVGSGLNFQGSLDAASLLGLLTRHGARLRTLFVEDLRATEADWPPLMQALSGLSRLTRLDLEVSGAPSTLSLACPQLRELSLDDLPGEAVVVLACPLLEQFVGLRDPSRQLALALPTPNLSF